MPRRYKPEKTARLFTKKIGYHEIDWNDWTEVIKRFEQQIRWWYVSPLEQLAKKSAHNGFAVVALGCVLIDALSQYDAGSEQGSGPIFTRFVRARLPHRCAPPFNPPIRIWNERNGNEKTARDFADVLWHGFRCGILHEAHVPLYGRLWGVTSVFEYAPTGYGTYADTGAACPCVSINPGEFVREVVGLFRWFIKELKHPSNPNQRPNFQKKFLVSYGIDIGNEP